MNFDGSLSNPFGQPSFDSHDFQYQSFPVCMDSSPKYHKCRNTPISKFSQTNNSNSKTTELEFQQLTSQIQQVVEEGADRMTKITMTVQQLSKIYALHEVYSDLKCHAQVLEQRNEEMAIELQKQRVKTNHFEKALNMIKKQDQNILKELTQKTERVLELEQKLSREINKNEQIYQQFEANKAENSYLKELILLANQNYEILEKKHKELEEQKKQFQQKNFIKEKQIHRNMESMKDVFIELITDLQNKQEKQIPNLNKVLQHATSKNHTNIKSNYSSNQNQNDKLHNIWNNMHKQYNQHNAHKQHKQLKENKKQQTGTFKNLKSPTTQKEAEEIYRNFFIKTLKSNK